MTEPLIFTHPLSGEFLEGEENLAAAVEDGFERVKALQDRIAPLMADTAVAEYVQLRREKAELLGRMEPLRVALAELRGPAVLPPRRQRTRTQELVGFCPRCSGRLDGAA